jgi:membrane protein DedA with SNARE-associated domain
MNEVNQYIVTYGYFAIFLFVFLQELGVPNPVTNEFILLYAGYLAHKGLLNLLLIMLVSVSADFSGTCILYFVFYAFGNYIIAHKPRWLPLSEEKIRTWQQLIYKGKRRSVYVGRLIPFLRGYVSVAAGLLQVKPMYFVTTVFTSAITWSGGLVFLGWILAPYWSLVMKNTGFAKSIALILMVVVLIYLTGKYLTRQFFAGKSVE